jgi:hypothetical protein
VPPTPLTATLRYTPPQQARKYYWVTTIATQATPSRGELNAGTDLSAEISDVNGFELTGDSADAPDLASQFVAQVPARITASDSEIVFYASSSSSDVRTVLPRGTTGFVCILPEGDITGQKMEVWPAKVKSMFLDSSIEDPAKVHVQFSITKLPSQNVTIP